MRCLNCLVRGWKIAAYQNVNVLVVDLSHGIYPGCQSDWQLLERHGNAIDVPSSSGRLHLGASRPAYRNGSELFRERSVLALAHRMAGSAFRDLVSFVWVDCSWFRL